MRFSIIQLKQLSEDSEVSGNKLRNFKLLAFLEGAGIVYTGGRRRRRGILQDARSQPGMEWLSNDEYSRKRRFMRIRTRVSDNARVYLYTSSFPFRSLHSAHSARRYSYPDRIVLRSPNTRLWPSAQLVHRPAISRGETNAESQVFLIALHGILRRPPSLLSFPTFPNLDRPRIEHSILRSIDSCFLAPNRPLLNSTETFLLANEFRDFPSISHSTRGTTPLVKFPSKFHDR